MDWTGPKTMRLTTWKKTKGLKGSSTLADRIQAALERAALIDMSKCFWDVSGHPGWVFACMGGVGWDPASWWPIDCK